METDTSEIKTLKRIVWRTAIAGRVERFEKLLNDPETQKHFGESFVTALTSKIERLFRLQIVLAAIYLSLMLSLYAAQDPNKSEFQILGYSFKNLGYYKEFLLFVAALLTPTSSLVSAYHRYLGELRKVALCKVFPNADIREFASHIYSDAYIDALVKDRRLDSRSPHGFTTALVAFFGIAIVALTIGLLVASLLLQISVISDVASKPSSSPAINAFIVAFSLGSIALSWLVGMLQLPLPEVDIGAFIKLSELRDKDPEKYQEAMNRISVESAKRDKVFAIVTGVTTFVVVYALVAMFMLTPELRDSARVTWRALPGIALSVFVATTVMKHLQRRIYRSYFRKYPDGTDGKLMNFTRTTKLVGMCRAALLVLCSLIYSLLAFGK